MSEEEKDKKRACARNRYCNMTEEEKDKKRAYAEDRCYRMIKTN